MPRREQPRAGQPRLWPTGALHRVLDSADRPSVDDNLGADDG